MKIHDISRPLQRGIAVWPGDEPFQSEWAAVIGSESSVNLGVTRLSNHTGSHADAPFHFEQGGATIDQIPLDHFYGPALVVEITSGDRIELGHVSGIDFQGIQRILFKTRSSYVPYHTWIDSFLPVDPGVIRYLASKQVILLGTDAPSVDPPDSETLSSHHELARFGIINLENLDLGQVHPGIYTLCAFPLKLIGMDAAPVRAVLVEH